MHKEKNLKTLLSEKFIKSRIGNSVFYHSFCGHFIVSEFEGNFTLTLNDNKRNENCVENFIFVKNEEIVREYYKLSLYL